MCHMFACECKHKSWSVPSRTSFLCKYPPVSIWWNSRDCQLLSNVNDCLCSVFSGSQTSTVEQRCNEPTRVETLSRCLTEVSIRNACKAVRYMRLYLHTYYTAGKGKQFALVYTCRHTVHTVRTGRTY